LIPTVDIKILGRDKLLNVSEALEKLLNAFSPVEVEEVPLHKAVGRVLSASIASQLDLPLFSNSSMDGFAVIAEDVENAHPDKPVSLSVVEDIPAGSFPSKKLDRAQTARIMTGAPLPEGADAIVPVEDTDQFARYLHSETEFPTKVNINKNVQPGDYVRFKGEDVSNGDVVFEANTKLRPQDIGSLAMLGIANVSVFRRPRIVILSTGDELVPVEIPLQPGKIHDSNAYTLSALIARDGGDAIYLGIVPDKEESVREILETAAESRADLILSSAGVSVGAFDFVRTVVQQDGKLDFWRVNMRPGKPLAFGNFHSVPFIGLPGNPVSAFVGYEVFVRPAISRLAGLKKFTRNQIRATIRHEIHSDGRESFLRAVLEKQEDGSWSARLTGHQGSGNLLSLVQANALLIIPSGVKSLPSGSDVDAWLLN
jgi:molybdopterin molybdotransferase